MNIKEKFEAFAEEYGHEPNYAKATIEWEDDGNTCDVLVKLNNEYQEDEDDEIFYYFGSLDELIETTNKGNGEDFFVIEDSITFC